MDIPEELLKNINGANNQEDKEQATQEAIQYCMTQLELANTILANIGEVLDHID